MTNVPPLAASAAPIRSGTDDGVRAGRSVRASSKRGAVAGGPVGEVVVGGRGVVAVDAVVVVGDRVVVVLSGSVSVVAGRVTVLVVRGSVRVVTGRVTLVVVSGSVRVVAGRITLVVVSGSVRVVPRVIVVVGMTRVVVLSEGTVEVVGMGSAGEAPGRIASMRATRTTRPRGPPGPLIWTRSRGLRPNPRGAIHDAPERHRMAAPEGRQSPSRRRRTPSFTTGSSRPARESGRRRTRRVYLASPDEDPEEVLREGLPADRPTPEEMTAYRERLEIVARCVEKLDIARLKFVENLPEKEIALRLNLTRDGVASQLKRIRRGLRVAFGDAK